MNENNKCFECTLHRCISNKNETDKYLDEIHNQCIIDIIGSKRPVDCSGPCKFHKNKVLPREFEKLIHSFQIAEGNTPCFRLAWSCNGMGG